MRRPGGNSGFQRVLEWAQEMKMLWAIVAILLIMWLLGISFHIAGGLDHILLVIALVVIVVNLLSGRRALGSTMFFGKNIAGFLIVISCLVFGARVLPVPAQWIFVGALV